MHSESLFSPDHFRVKLVLSCRTSALLHMLSPSSGIRIVLLDIEGGIPVKLEVDSFELRRICLDVIYVYKLLFGMVDLNFDDFFARSSCSTTRGHNYKLF